MLDCIEPGRYAGEVAGPDFAYYEDVFGFIGTVMESVVNMSDPVLGEGEAEMLHSVQPESIDSNFIHHPLAPFLHLFADIRVGVIDVGEHEIIVIAVFFVYIIGPSLAWSTGWLTTGFGFLAGV